MNSNIISIAPMLDWTDRHFRYFMRLICHQPMLYSELVVSTALLLGNREKLLAFNSEEHPVTLQIGGNNPQLMAQSAVIAQEYGYDGININAGCPSSRVQSGQFGAVLMKDPKRLADCVQAMHEAVSLPISVKTRISLTTSENKFDDLFYLAECVKKAGCSHLIIHARQAHLSWSVDDNRTRLPLDYDTVYQLKKSFPDLFISINGNVLNLEDIKTHLSYVDGVMIGRWAYGNPYALKDIDSLFFKDEHLILSRYDILKDMINYTKQHIEYKGIILSHLMGLFYSTPLSKEFKKMLNNRDLNELEAWTENLPETFRSV